jgi:MFS family permease
MTQAQTNALSSSTLMDGVSTGDPNEGGFSLVTSSAVNTENSRIYTFFSAIPKTIWVLGAAMGLLNISVVMVYSLSALYLNSIVGVGAIWIGALEGIVEGLSFLMKLFSGVFSDYLKRRKKLMVIGYALTVISKPLIGISSSFFSVFTARIIERLGNGIQSTPRDALIGDIAPATLRGTCYGFQRGLGIVGSMSGAIFGVLAMVYFSNDFQSVFLVASIPAFLALALLIIFVKEPKQHKLKGDVIVGNERRHPIHFSDLKRLGKHYWLLMVVISIFWVARVSETFIVLHAHNNFALDKSYAPFIMLTYNVTYCLSSFACGYFSDKIGRYWLMVASIAVLMMADFFICSSTSLPMLFVGILIWGVQMGMSMNLFTAKIADLSPPDLRGTAFGCYYLISSISTVIAGIANGAIASQYGESMTFFMSMIIAGVALASLLLFLPRPQKRVAISE